MTAKHNSGIYAPDGSLYITLTDGEGNLVDIAAGSVTDVSVVTANGISGSVATSTTTPAITLTLGDISPTSITGTTTNDNAAVGKIGEYVSATTLIGSAVSLTSTTPANVASISLTAGDWDVWAVSAYTGGATTTISYTQNSISVTSATLSGVIPSQISTYNAGDTPFATINQICIAIPPIRLSLATTMTVYLVANASFDISTLSAFGNIAARRVR